VAAAEVGDDGGPGGAEDFDAAVAGSEFEGGDFDGGEGAVEFEVGDTVVDEAAGFGGVMMSEEGMDFFGRAEEGDYLIDEVSGHFKEDAAGVDAEFLDVAVVEIEILGESSAEEVDLAVVLNAFAHFDHGGHVAEEVEELDVEIVLSGAAVEFLEFGEVRPGGFFEEDGELVVDDAEGDVEIVRDATVDDDGVERVIEDLGFGIAPMEIREEGDPFPFAGGDDFRFGVPGGEELEFVGVGGDLADQAGGVGVPGAEEAEFEG